MAQTLLLQNARPIDGLADQPREKASILMVIRCVTPVNCVS
ncbi:MAG TPA: hypothetical protein VKJ47_03285 [Candidatus Binatia bacterium]|nr:hypothetical protein [Candidatus Binatia bacterium]